MQVGWEAGSWLGPTRCMGSFCLPRRCVGLCRRCGWAVRRRCAEPPPLPIPPLIGHPLWVQGWFDFQGQRLHRHTWPQALLPLGLQLGGHRGLQNPTRDGDALAIPRHALPAHLGCGHLSQCLPAVPRLWLGSLLGCCALQLVLPLALRLQQALVLCAQRGLRFNLSLHLGIGLYPFLMVPGQQTRQAGPNHQGDT